jgi:hypothetical protein
MRCLIPTYNRAGTITTATLLRDAFFVTILTHTEREREAIAEAQPELRDLLLVTNVPSGPHGANAQRAWAAEHLLQPNEWCLYADDNIRSIVSVREDLYTRDELPVRDVDVRQFDEATWNSVYDYAIDAARLRVVIHDMLIRAEARGYWSCGFGTNTSALYRPRHWRTVGYVSSKLMLWKHDVTFPWHDMVHMDDFNYSAEQHLRHGGVLINHWIHPKATHYAGGGLGAYRDRVSKRQESVALLMERYPGLLRVKSRPGFAPNSELTFALRSPREVAAWRAGLLTGT